MLTTSYVDLKNWHLFCIFFWRARVCWPLLCLCRPFWIFERCPDSNPESCRSKQARYQPSHLSPPKKYLSSAFADGTTFFGLFLCFCIFCRHFYIWSGPFKYLRIVIALSLFRSLRSWIKIFSVLSDLRYFKANELISLILFIFLISLCNHDEIKHHLQHVFVSRIGITCWIVLFYTYVWM